MKADPPPPALQLATVTSVWTRELKHDGGDELGETAAVQSSGLATDNFHKTQTPWEGELRIKL